MERTNGGFVIVSHLHVEDAGVAALEDAFQKRLGSVEASDGFRGLEVWRDVRVSGDYRMLSWWDSPQDFTAYMRSAAHRESHARVPASPVRAVPRGVSRHLVIAR